MTTYCDPDERARLVAMLRDLYRNGPTEGWRDDVRDAADEMDLMLLEIRQGLEAGKSIEGHRDRLMAERDAAEARLRTLLDAIGDPDALLAVADGSGLLPGDAAWLTEIADAAAAAVSSGDEEDR